MSVLDFTDWLSGCKWPNFWNSHEMFPLFDCGSHKEGKHFMAIPEVGPFDRDFSIHDSNLRELLKIPALQRDPAYPFLSARERGPY